PDPPRLEADSSELRKLDSMHHAWKRDSILKLINARGDSLAKGFKPEDTITPGPSQTEPFRRIQRADPFTERALEYLRNWDGSMRANETAPTIYGVFLQQILEQTFVDELGPERFREWLFIQNVPVRTLQRLLKDDSNIWWDDVSTT